jgi:hypothetical protein
MGLDVLVPRGAGCDVAVLLERLAAAGLPCAVVMVDNQLHPPGQPVGAGWRDLRLKTGAGTVSLKREAQGVRVVVFGNADEALLAAQRTIAAALEKV